MRLVQTDSNLMVVDVTSMAASATSMIMTLSGANPDYLFVGNGYIIKGGKYIVWQKPIIGNLTSDEGTEYYIGAYLEYVDGKLRLMNYATDQLVSEVDLSNIGTSAQIVGYPYILEFEPKGNKEDSVTFNIKGTVAEDYSRMKLFLMRRLNRHYRGGANRTPTSPMGWRHPMHMQNVSNSAGTLVFPSFPRETEFAVSGSQITVTNICNKVVKPYISYYADSASSHIRYMDCYGYAKGSGNIYATNISRKVPGNGFAIFIQNDAGKWEQASNIVAVDIGVNIKVDIQSSQIINAECYNANVYPA